ncbi:MAG: hypothetical protein PHW19_08970 [Salinivirgaceae bacterium]|nr:hypothetical protein [Salinivirgaceae bacterium]
MESELKKAYDLISNEELESALKIVSEHLLNDCIMLMASLTKIRNRYELYSLYYENYLDFVGKIRAGKFDYASDAAFKSFFKTGCSYRAKEYKRTFSKTDEWPAEHLADVDPEFINGIFQEKKEKEYSDVYERYGIHLEDVAEEEIFPAEVIKTFHTLNEKCKFLVVMKYMLNLSHKNIVDCLCNFYELKNENVSKSELKRCIEKLKKGVVLQ